MEIDLIGIALPDLDHGILHRVAADVEDSADEMGDFAHSRGGAVVDDDEIVIGVEGELIGVEGPFGEGGCPHELFGEQSGGYEERCPERARKARRLCAEDNGVIGNLSRGLVRIGLLVK